VVDAGPAFTTRLIRITARVALAVVLVTASAAIGGTPARSAVLPAAALVPSYGAMWGAWAAPGSTGAVAAFEGTIGRRLDIVHQYHAFDEVWPTSTEYGWAAGGRTIFANISARQRSGSVLTWSVIASGAEDSVIDAMAARIRAFGRLMFVSFDEEPENRYHDSPGTYTLASFNAAYKRIHSRFAADGARNVVWVWNVVGDPGDESLYTGGLYPGDSWVDWIGWDPYNWNTCIHPYGWRTFDQIVAPFYNWLSAGYLSGGSSAKPYMLAEYGSVENSGSPTKGQWFLGEASTMSSRPKLKALVYFNENKDCNWPITTSSSSVAGFAAAGRTCWVNRATPSRPTSVSASPGDGSATVRWAASSSVCPITGYTVYVSPGGRTVAASAASLSVTVGGLSNGTAYSFEVHSTSVNGNSAWSALSAAVTPSGATRASPSASASSSPTSAASPSSATTPVGKPAAAVTPAGGLPGWLESHLYVIPIAVIVLFGFGLGTQRLSSRQGRRG
jgi:fibronectin type III domain protein/glycosyl hydrolase family 26